MVIELAPPTRPLPSGGHTWTWNPRVGTETWTWCRIYHRGRHNRNGHTPRTFGPLARFDPHRPDPTGNPAPDAERRSVIYIGTDLATSFCEVFGAAGNAALCPRWRMAIIGPTVALPLFDLCRSGSAMAIGALPALADAALPGALTQQWARAIYEDQPARRKVTGVRYRSAYNAGMSLALWDAEGKIHTITDSADRAADFALTDALLLPRVNKLAATRQLGVEVIDSVDCADCRRDS